MATDRRSRVVVSARVPASLRARIDALVGPKGSANRNAAMVAALERAAAAAAPPSAPDTSKKPKRERLHRFHFRISEEQGRRLRAYAVEHGFTSVSAAAAHLVARALDEEEGRVAVPAQKAAELLEAVGGVAAVIDALGPGVLGLVRLLAHWAAKSGGLKVSEDELLAEVWSVGASEWAQLLEEMSTQADGKGSVH